MSRDDYIIMKYNKNKIVHSDGYYYEKQQE